MTLRALADDEPDFPNVQAVAEVLVRLSRVFEEDSADDDTDSLAELGLDFCHDACW